MHHQALYSLSYSYEHTLDQATAAAMFEQLEAYTRQTGSEFDGQSGALSNLALTALSRGNEDSAQRLLAEATAVLALETDLAQKNRLSVLYQISSGYGALQNERVKQRGFDTLRALAEDIIEPELIPSIYSVIILSDAGLY